MHDQAHPSKMHDFSTPWWADRRWRLKEETELKSVFNFLPFYLKTVQRHIIYLRTLCLWISVSATLEQLSKSDSPLWWVQIKVRKNGFSKVLNFWCEVWNNLQNGKIKKLQLYWHFDKKFYIPVCEISTADEPTFIFGEPNWRGRSRDCWFNTAGPEMDPTFKNDVLVGVE